MQCLAEAKQRCPRGLRRRSLAQMAQARAFAGRVICVNDLLAGKKLRGVTD